MFLIKGFLILGWFVAIPFCIGSLPVFLTGRKQEASWLDNFVCGYTVMFAIFELTALPAIFAGLSFHVLKYFYGGICLALAAASLLVNRKALLSGAAWRIKGLRQLPWTMWLAFLLIAIQVGAYVFGMATDLDDSFYVATATTTLETGGIFTHGAYTGRLTSVLPSRYVLAPFPILLAFYSAAVGMHPAAVAHTVQPIFFLLLSYITYGFIGKRLFKGDKKSTGFFLFFLALVQAFSYYSVYTQGTFMLIRIWQGKALLAAFLLPAIFYRARCCMEEGAEKGNWFRLLCLMMSSCLVSSMGMMLAPVMLGLLALLYGVPGWKWKKILAAFGCCVPNLCCAAIYLLVR